VKSVANNKKAFHDYEILDKFECGIVLTGSEVKAIRQGRVNLKDGFVKIIRGEMFLFNVHITHLSTTNSYFAPDEKRDRKLLAHKKDILKLDAKVAQDGLSIVPLSLYFNHKNLVKVQCGLGKGKKLYDKRETLKKKDMQRDIDRLKKAY
jgi:SsrA-binding protein